MNGFIVRYFEDDGYCGLGMAQCDYAEVKKCPNLEYARGFAEATSGDIYEVDTDKVEECVENAKNPQFWKDMETRT